MTTNTTDAGIPLLTEVIPAPAPASSPLIKPVTTITTAQENVATAGLHAEVRTDMLADAWDEERWERLEHELRERVLYQVLERIDFVLEQRVRDSLADALQTAVEGLANEIREGLHNSMRDVITRAVTHEITKLQATKK